VLFLATAQATDDEMAERIAKHKSSRPATWRTVEEPLEIASVLKSHAASSDIVILDCLTVWLGNMMSRDASASEEEALKEVERLLEVYKTGSASLILVSGEVGMGLVPPYPLGRAFRDIQGRINQRLAQEADRVVLMVAGIAVDVKK
jgi:adenosylcobinamide kinase/adenosylcobinamide-phosphate guanylyltransferase